MEKTLMCSLCARYHRCIRAKRSCKNYRPAEFENLYVGTATNIAVIGTPDGSKRYVLVPRMTGKEIALLMLDKSSKERKAAEKMIGKKLEDMSVEEKELAVGCLEAFQGRY